MKPIKFPVNDNHISSGKRGCNETCAVALAMREHLSLPSDKRLTINYHENGDVYGVCGEQKFDFKSVDLAQWLYNYDRGQNVEPVIVNIRFK